MNNHRRKYIKSAVKDMDIAIEKVQLVLEEEEDSLNNLPEQFEYSQKYANMEENIETLECVLDGIESVKSMLDSIL